MGMQPKFGHKNHWDSFRRIGTQRAAFASLLIDKTISISYSFSRVKSVLALTHLSVATSSLTKATAEPENSYRDLCLYCAAWDLLVSLGTNTHMTFPSVSRLYWRCTLHAATISTARIPKLWSLPHLLAHANNMLDLSTKVNKGIFTAKILSRRLPTARRPVSISFQLSLWIIASSALMLKRSRRQKDAKETSFGRTTALPIIFAKYAVGFLAYTSIPNDMV